MGNKYVDTELDILVRGIHECKPLEGSSFPYNESSLFLHCPDCKVAYHQEAGNHSAWECWELHQKEERHTDRATPAPQH